MMMMKLPGVNYFKCGFQGQGDGGYCFAFRAAGVAVVSLLRSLSAGSDVGFSCFHFSCLYFFFLD